MTDRVKKRSTRTASGGSGLPVRGHSILDVSHGGHRGILAKLEALLQHSALSLRLSLATAFTVAAGVTGRPGASTVLSLVFSNIFNSYILKNIKLNNIYFLFVRFQDCERCSFSIGNRDGVQEFTNRQQ